MRGAESKCPFLDVMEETKIMAIDYLMIPLSQMVYFSHSSNIYLANTVSYNRVLDFPTHPFNL